MRGFSISLVFCCSSDCGCYDLYGICNIATVMHNSNTIIM